MISMERSFDGSLVNATGCLNTKLNYGPVAPKSHMHCEEPDDGAAEDFPLSNSENSVC
jgi:hypothetical protein